MDEVRNRIARLTADALRVSAQDLSPEFAFRDDRRWDSITRLILMLAIEEEFDIKLSLTEVEDTRSIADVATLVMSKVNCGN